jgi:hypothetical protein
MVVFKWLKDTVQFLWRGTIRLFSPSDDNYPETGIQPFEGEPYEENEKIS